MTNLGTAGVVKPIAARQVERWRRPRTVRQVERLRRWIRVFLGLTVRAAAAMAAIFQTLFTLKILVGWSSAWVLVPLFVAVGGTFIEGAMLLVGRSRHPLRRVQVEDLRQALASLALRVQPITGIPLEHIGSGIWLVRSYRPWLWSPRLERVIRFRLNTYPAPSDIDWTKGKGAVGRCWESGLDQHQPWRNLCRRYGRELSDAQWKGLSQGKSFGFTREEFQSMLGKYSEVLAYPIKDRNGGKVIGVLSIDVPIDAVADDVNRLDTKEVRRAAHAAVQLISTVVEPR